MMQITPMMNQLGALSASSEAPGVEAGGDALFTSQLLGFLGQVQVGGATPAEAEQPSLLQNLQHLLQTDSLSGLGVPEEELDGKSDGEELTMEDMAELLGIDVEALQAFHAALLKEMHITSGSVEAPDDLQELVAGILQLSKELPSAIKSQPLEQAVKLIRAMQLLSASGKSEWNDTFESAQIKESLKELLVRMEGTGQAVTRKDPDLKTGNQVDKVSREVPASVNAFQPATSAQSTVTVKASLFVKPEQPESVVQQFQSLLGKTQFSSMGSMSKLFIKLYPEHLGSVRIELLQQNGVMTAKILASSASAKEMLDSHLQGLKQAFHSQNIQVDKIEVSQSLSDPERAFKGQSHQQPKEHGQKQGGHDREQDADIDTDFKELLIKNEQVIT
jgi:flagellar hook-length control protein FliK